MRTAAWTTTLTCAAGLLGFALLGGAWGEGGGGGESIDARDAAEWRRPSGAVLLDSGRRLAVANESTGTVSLVDVETTTAPENAATFPLVSETAIGGRLTSIAPGPRDREFLLADAAGHRVLLSRMDEDRVAVVAEAPVARHPVSLLWSDDLRLVAVASLWSHTVTLFSISGAPESQALQAQAVIDLPFAPRLLASPSGTDWLIVADAFGGKLGLVDLPSGQLISLREIPGGNIRGLAISRDVRTLAISQQMTNGQAQTTNDDIHWGTLAQNVIRLVPLASLFDPSAALYRDSRVLQLGQPGFGAADPAGLVELESGDWLVTLSGTGDALIVNPFASPRARIAVGDRPLQVLLDASGRRAFAVSQLTNAIAVVDVEEGELDGLIPLGPAPPETPASRGERLFFSAGLSHDRWLSCHSCHTDGHSNGRLIDTKGDNTFGTPKRVLTLLGTRDANPWAWNGEFKELHDQVRQSIESSMQGRRPSAQQVADLVAFLHTLEPAPPLHVPATDAERDVVERGRTVFHREGCGECHIPSLTYTSNGVYDVGLVDEAGASKFNPPSLRGVSQRDTLFHDGRATSLRAVFEDYGHQLSGALDEPDLQALLEFLRTL
ncbi:MAG: hypothetical protein KF774_00505 [Planctomyces sp.]|nr:hypothetical protein [Planctomyces sp.]